MLDRVVVAYDLQRYPFPTVVRDHLGLELATLHEHYHYDRLVRGTEQHTELHARLYALGAPFHELYRRFVREVVQPALGGELLVQIKPNFRFQLPGNVAVRGFHRDRDDGHQMAEINCWVPLTPVVPTTAVWIETYEGSGDHTSAPAQPGQLLLFDGANLEHGNLPNESPSTRVSFDFRVARAQAFVPSDARSMYRSVRFSIGEYFEPLEIEEGSDPRPDPPPFAPGR